MVYLDGTCFNLGKIRGRIFRFFGEVNLPIVKIPFGEFHDDLLKQYTLRSNDSDFLVSAFTIDVQEKLRQCLAEMPVLEFVHNTFYCTLPSASLNEKDVDKFLDLTQKIVLRLKQMGEFLKA